MSAAAPVPLDPRLAAEVARHPFPLVFATVSGAHLYGFPSPDSDYDLRGVHVLPLEEALKLEPGPETVERSGKREDLELDLVTHDIRKFFAMLLKRNGYVLEQLYSPLVVHTTPEHEELKDAARGCITRHHAHHYLGFARTQWDLFAKETPRRVKPLLYVFRVILTGIHLVRSGIVEANLEVLNAEHRLPYLTDLIERKRSGEEQVPIQGGDLALYESEYGRLLASLQAARDASPLPEAPSARPALDDLLVRIRKRPGEATSGHRLSPPAVNG